MVELRTKGKSCREESSLGTLGAPCPFQLSPETTRRLVLWPGDGSRIDAPITPHLLCLPRKGAMQISGRTTRPS